VRPHDHAARRPPVHTGPRPPSPALPHRAQTSAWRRRTPRTSQCRGTNLRLEEENVHRVGGSVPTRRRAPPGGGRRASLARHLPARAQTSAWRRRTPRTSRCRGTNLRLEEEQIHRATHERQKPGEEPPLGGGKRASARPHAALHLPARAQPRLGGGKHERPREHRQLAASARAQPPLGGGKRFGHGVAGARTSSWRRSSFTEQGVSVQQSEEPPLGGTSRTPRCWGTNLRLEEENVHRVGGRGARGLRFEEVDRSCSLQGPLGAEPPSRGGGGFRRRPRVVGVQRGAVRGRSLVEGTVH
jgi:hypothetical protein